MAFASVKAIDFHQRPVVLTATFSNKESAEALKKDAEEHRDLYALKTFARNLPGFIEASVA